MNRARKHITTFGMSLVAALYAAGARAHDAPEYVRVRSISYAGSGCPAGTVAENLSADYQAFTLLFDAYIAEVGPAVPLRESRKNCQINLDLEFPQGWSYTIATVDYRGYGHLESGVTGLQKSSYYFQGDFSTGSLQTQFRGPMNSDYQIRDTLALTALVWSPCGASRSLNINTQVRVDNSRARRRAGILTLDSIDGQLTHIYHVTWRRCH